MTAIDTTAAAFVAGMVTSLHCVGMCGPLSCSWAISSRSGSTFFRDTSLYHLGRLLAYACVGAAAGAIGTVPLRFFQRGAGVWLPWLIVVAFAVVGMGLDKYVPKPAFMSATVRRLQTRAMRMKSGVRAASLGLLTPLLPCGPLYLMFALAMVNGSAAKGAGFLSAFALGTLPLLGLAQFQLHWLGGKLSPVTMKRMQRGLALVTAVLLAWRLRGTFGPEEAALTCCHGA
jgi:sulfite exporter TauE/SafE